MNQKDYFQQASPQIPYRQHCYHYQNGYFGKPTKLRCLEPSMFQILTWDEQKIKQKSKSKQKKFPQCNCRCSPEILSPQKDELKRIRHHSPNVSSKTLKQDGLRKHNYTNKQKQGDLVQAKNRSFVGNPAVEQAKSPPQKGPKKQNHLSRPKSAQGVPRSVQINNHNIISNKYSKIVPEQCNIQQKSIQQKQRLIQKFKQTTRWIPNSSFTTYFGKPAFQNYGRCNTNPTFGGLMYGNYLKTHNIQPHRGVNSPKSIQSYNVALSKAQQLGAIYPYPPKVANKQNTILKQKAQQNVSSCQIYAQENNFYSLPVHAPDLYELEKFGGKGLQKVSQQRLQRSHIQKFNEKSSNNYQQKNPSKVQIGSSQKLAYEGVKYS